MFQVKNKETGQEYTVYAVGDEYLTRFLIYEDNHWKWQCMDDFVPVNTKLEDFLSIAKEIPLKDQENVDTEEKNVQEDNSEDYKSRLSDSDCAPWIEA